MIIRRSHRYSKVGKAIQRDLKIFYQQEEDKKSLLFERRKRAATLPISEPSPEPKEQAIGKQVPNFYFSYDLLP